MATTQQKSDFWPNLGAALVRNLGHIAKGLLTGEATGLTVSIAAGLWLWIIPWRPSTVEGVGMSWFIAGMVAAYYMFVQMRSLAKQTEDEKMGDDQWPVVSVILSLLPGLTAVIAIVLHIVAGEPGDDWYNQRHLDQGEWGVILWIFAFAGGEAWNNTLILIRLIRRGGLRQRVEERNTGDH